MCLPERFPLNFVGAVPSRGISEIVNDTVSLSTFALPEYIISPSERKTIIWTSLSRTGLVSMTYWAP